MGILRSNRSFRRLFVGRLATNAGDSLYYIAAMWLVWELTNDPLFTGIAGFLTQAPNAAQFLAGPLVDRWPLRRVLVGAQTFQAVAVLLVPLAAVTGHLSVWVVLLVVPTLAIVDQFTSPAQTAALPQVVADEELATANSLYSTTAKAANTVFNALSGVLVAAVGAVTLYVVDAVTFALAALLFLGVRFRDDSETDGDEAVSDPDTPENDLDAAEDDTDTVENDTDTAENDTDTAESSAWTEYKDDLAVGSQYLRGSVLLTIVVGATAVNFLAAATLAVLPAFAAGFGGAGSYGLLMAAYSAGSLVGAAGSSVVADRPYGRIAVGSLVTAGVATAGAAAAGWFPATAALFGLAAVPMGVFNVLFQSLLQSTVAEDLLGRVSSLIGSGVALAMPLGSLAGGAVADIVGAPGLLLAQGVGVTTLGVVFLLRPRVRSLPPVAEADERLLGLGTTG